MSALLFSPTRKEPKRGPLKTTTTERERERNDRKGGSGERAESAFLVALFNRALRLRRAFFFLRFLHKTNGRDLVDATER